MAERTEVLLDKKTAAQNINSVNRYYSYMKNLSQKKNEKEEK